MVDTLAVDAAGHAVLLYVAGVAGSHEERGASVDVAHGTVEALRIVPTDEIPPIDRPTLIECGHELWLVAEVLVGPAIDAGEAPETAVMAVPAECILSRAHDQR
jgi:hypothetical protein